MRDVGPLSKARRLESEHVSSSESAPVNDSIEKAQLLQVLAAFGEQYRCDQSVCLCFART